MYREEFFYGTADYQCSRALAFITEGGLLPDRATIRRDGETWYLEFRWEGVSGLAPGHFEEIRLRCVEQGLKYEGGSSGSESRTCFAGAFPHTHKGV